MIIFQYIGYYDIMFDGDLENCADTNFKIDLVEGVELYHDKPFPIPKVHEETIK